MRVIPPCIKKEGSNPNKVQIETRGRAKEDVLKRDPKLTKLIGLSVYDTEPVHYISMVSEELKRVVKEKE